MKKIYTLLTAAVVAVPTFAQQLPNNGFEEEWVDCVPWTSAGNTKTKGTTPKSWTISQVIGINSLGATIVGEDIIGYNSVKAASIYNSPNSLMKTQKVPGYITLGTTWSTAKGMSAANKDGGTFGGIEFKFRPDAISFYYQRNNGDGSTEPATVVAYLWKGTWSQAAVPGDIALGNTKATTMIDRERNILGMATDQGGEVTKTDDAERIAKINYSITSPVNEWTNLVIPFEYESDNVPEKINVIFAANNYFDSSNVKEGDLLNIDDVKLLYYSKASSIKIGGVAIEGFDAETYSYTVNGAVPAASEVEVAMTGKSAKSEVAVDAEAATVTVKVTNDGPDADGLTEHTYVIKYAAEGDATVTGTQNIPGKLDINMMGSDLAKGQDAEITITYYSNGKCDFLLPNFTLEGLGNFGDILVKDLTITEANGVKTFKGAVSGMKLLDGEIVADVEVNGTIDADMAAKFDISVMWSGVPIAVTFNG
ncbi:MAG: calycin-like domain-containing protein, partial [Muribaculaceae bacterium]|nr:calycin-like domain-containing protein [Muribaculaceae bacterium]